MGMFFNSMRKPRGFNHQYIYVNERKEKIPQQLFHAALLLCHCLLWYAGDKAQT